MSKSTHFFGQPVYGQLIKSLDHDKIVEMSRKNGGERYVKSFDGYAHLVTMLYAVIMRFDSLREIEAAMTAEVRKLHHVGIKKGKWPKVGIVAYQRLRHATANHSCHISQEVANRVTLQTDQAEFPS